MVTVRNAGIDGLGVAILPEHVCQQVRCLFDKRGDFKPRQLFVTHVCNVTLETSGENAGGCHV